MDKKICRGRTERSPILVPDRATREINKHYASNASIDRVLRSMFLTPHPAISQPEQSALVSPLDRLPSL